MRIYRKLQKGRGYFQIVYILLGGVNDNEADIDAFADIAIELNAQVRISGDMSNINSRYQYTERMYTMAERLIAKLGQAKIKIWPKYDKLNPAVYKWLDKKICRNLNYE
jgi:adenine C2-methylase RlmN of 23S rRNA A2503 and tRNA A37